MSTNEIYATLDLHTEATPMLSLEKDNGLCLTIPTDEAELEDFTSSQGWSFGWKHEMIITDPAEGRWPAQLEEPSDFFERVFASVSIEQFAKEFSQYEIFASMQSGKEITLTETAQAA